jgi:hypothetical protein
MAAGHVEQVSRSVVIVSWETAEPLPLLTLLNAGAGAGSKLCVVACPAPGKLRCVVVPPDAPPQVGSVVQPTGKSWSKALDDAGVGEFVRGLELKPSGELLETGLKAIDFLCPLQAGGALGLFGGSNVGATVVIEELHRRLKNSASHQHLIYLVGRNPQPPLSTVRAEAAEEALGPFDGDGPVQLDWLPATSATEPSYAAGGASEVLPSVLFLSPGGAVRGLYPAVDGLRSSAQLLLDPRGLGEEHFEVWQHYRESLKRVSELSADPQFWELVALRAPSASRRHDQFEAQLVSMLPAEQAKLLDRVRKVETYLTQPFFVAEPFTGMPGQSVSRAETVKTIAAILDGACDSIERRSLYMKGSVPI